MMKTNDSSSDEEQHGSIEAMNNKIKKYIRLKETENIQNKISILNGSEKKSKNCVDDDQDSYTSSSVSSSNDSSMEEDDKNNDKLIRLGHIQEWSKIKKCLKQFKQNNQNHRYLEMSTHILKMHIEHRCYLDVKCFELILHCIDPNLVVNLFEMNLIESNDLFHIGCLLESENMFAGIREYDDDILASYKYASQIFLSLSIILYKYKCYDHLKAIVSSLDCLAIFINREECDNKRIGKIKLKLEKSVKILIHALVMNKILNKKKLKQFLLTSNIETIRIDDEDYEFEQMQSVCKRLNINQEEINRKMFPLSLQRMCRVVIKKNMNDYSIQGVNQLKVLPNELKKFVLFDQEINDILKLNSFFYKK